MYENKKKHKREQSFLHSFNGSISKVTSVKRTHNNVFKDIYEKKKEKKYKKTWAHISLVKTLYCSC